MRDLRLRTLRSAAAAACAVVFAVLAVFAATGPEVARAAGGDDARLSYFRSVPGATQWVLWSARDGGERVVLSAPTDPRLVFWEADRRAALYVLAGEILRVRLDDAAPVPARVAPTPREADGELRAVWIERGTRRLRALAMRRVDDRDVVVRDGRVSYRAPDGGLVPAARLPDWGIAYLCTVLEWRGDASGWRVLARRATKDDAGETPGIAVADDLRDELGRSSERLARSYTCESGRCRNDVAPHLAAAASAAAGRRLSNDDLSVWRAGPGLRPIVFGTVMGDTLHTTPPVLLASPDLRSATPIATGERSQIGLGVAGGLLLVADEWSGARPVVVDLRSGSIRLRVDDARGAVWVPPPPR